MDSELRRFLVGILKKLLMNEYRQRDVYETYSYWIMGKCAPGIREHLVEHMGEEMKHIDMLQRYLAGFGEGPVVDRLPIPEVEPTLEAILRLDLKLEREAVRDYENAIEAAGDIGRGAMALRVDLENVLAQEQEHVHDLERWLS